MAAEAEGIHFSAGPGVPSPLLPSRIATKVTRDLAKQLAKLVFPRSNGQATMVDDGSKPSGQISESKTSWC